MYDVARADDRDRAMEFTIAASSGSRWNGFEATLYETSAGFVQACITSHGVSMHVSEPVLVSMRCGDMISIRRRESGDIDIVPAGVPASWSTDGPAMVLALYVKPDLVRSVATGMDVNPDYMALVPQQNLRDQRLQSICWELKHELLSNEPGGRLYAESLGVALTSHLLRRYARSGPRITQVGLPKRRLERVTEYIDENLARDLSLAELASVAGMSPSHFKALFKQSVGMPAHQYVIRQRVDRAVKLLSHGSAELGQVALEAGFSNQSHMTRCMRQIVGKTPGALLREL